MDTDFTLPPTAIEMHMVKILIEDKARTSVEPNFDMYGAKQPMSAVPCSVYFSFVQYQK